MNRRRSPDHDFWHPRVEAAIRSCIATHPAWFSIPNAQHERALVNSLARRIVGQVIAGDRERRHGSGAAAPRTRATNRAGDCAPRGCR